MGVIVFLIIFIVFCIKTYPYVEAHKKNMKIAPAKKNEHLRNGSILILLMKN